MNNPTPGADDPNLLVAVQALATKVSDLTGHLSVSQDQANRTERQARRTKYLTRIVLVLTLLSLIGVFVTGILVGRVQDAVDSNEANAVTNCQNANESRRANKVLWDFLIDASLAQDTQTPESAALLTELQTFISALYEARDCSDLSRQYELPKPPAITDLTPDKSS